jgi:hypothetical protein
MGRRTLALWTQPPDWTGRCQSPRCYNLVPPRKPSGPSWPLWCSPRCRMYAWRKGLGPFAPTPVAPVLAVQVPPERRWSAPIGALMWRKVA